MTGRSTTAAEARIAIVIPALNEAATIEDTVAAARLHADEVFVVDAGSEDDTVALASRAGAHSLQAARGRASQMNAGAGAALAVGADIETPFDLLVFLHADTRLAQDARRQLVQALASGARWGRFDVRLDADRVVLRIVERAMNLRSRLTGICTGDQAIFVVPELWQRVGGFPAIPLMEDIALSRLLRRHARPACLPGPVTTSARRWLARGPIRTIVEMWCYRALYWIGVSPWTLHRLYYGRPAQEAGGSVRCRDGT